MVGIVILDYNNASDTINCIESVVKYTPKGAYKLVVVENGSNDGTVNAISQYVKQYEDYMIGDDNSTYPINLPFITLFNSRTNDGYARGNNKGLMLLDKDEDITHVMILNNDILFIEDIVSPLLLRNNSLPNCGIVSSMLLKKDQKEIDVNCARLDYLKRQFFFQYLFMFKDFFGILSKYEQRQGLLTTNPELANKDFIQVEMPSGSCMMIRKALFREIGYFDPHTFLYFEENILFRKLHALGLKNYVIPSVKCVHLGAATTSKQETSYFLNMCHMESNAYYLRKYCNAPIWAIYVRLMSKLTLLKIHIQSKFFVREKPKDNSAL